MSAWLTMPAPLNAMEANMALNAKDGFQPTEVDEHVEAEARATDLGRLPSDSEILAAVAQLPRGN